MREAFLFNLPWPATLLGAIFYAAGAAWALRFAREFTGLLHLAFVGASAFVLALGLVMLTRRIVFPRYLLLDDMGMIFPRGFPRTRKINVQWDEIIRMFESGEGTRAAIYLGTSRGGFDIGASYFDSIEDYNNVRSFISSKTGVSFEVKAPHTSLQEQLPKPLLHWKEPVDWPQYRTHLVRSTCLRNRLLKALWFSLRWLSVFVLPWLLLRIFQIPTSTPLAHLSLSGVAALFFTWVHWIHQVWPVHCTEIAVRANGISQNLGEQIWESSFKDISAYNVIERNCQRCVLRILLTEERARVRVIALPDAATGERLREILKSKGVPEVPELTAPWEARLKPISTGAVGPCSGS